MLVTRAQQALADEGLAVRVACFEPADRPVLWWPAEAAESESVQPQATLLLNSSNSAVKRLLCAPSGADISAPLRALYITGLIFGRAQPTARQAGLLRTAVLDMIEDTLSDGE